jgi:HSP20 family protein
MKTRLTPVVFHNHRSNFVDAFDSMFDKIIQTNFPQFSQEFGVDLFAKGSYPKVNITDYDDKVVITAEVAGLTKEDVDIEYKDNVLTISGAKAQDTEDIGVVVLRELKKSSFRRSWNVNEEVLDCTKANATFHNGVLDLTLPKKEPKVEISHKIEIL